MNAHRMVIIAAALTVVVAAALATALAAVSGQTLPRAVRHDLGGAGGTALVITGNVNASQGAPYTSQLPGMISTALAGTPFAFYHAYWSDPLGFVAGSRPAQPASAGNQPIAEAAVLDGITAHAVLISGRWPGAPVSGQPIPTALPAAAAALLHVTDGDTLRMKDRISGQYVRFVVTGLYRPRQVSSEYWNLNEIALSGASTASGFTTYGPLAVQAGAFAGQGGALAVYEGSWLVACVLLAGLLAGTGSAGTGSAGTGSAGTGSAGDDRPAIVVAAAVAAGAMVIMVAPALSIVTPGTARARRGRQAAVSGLTKAGADLALVLLAVVAGWQLRHYSAVSAGANGNFGVDPVIVIAPALALAGGTVLALRLLPAGGKAGDRPWPRARTR